MALMLLQLSLFAATFIQLTSSQNIYIYQQGDGTCVSSSCGRTEEMLSEIQGNITQLMTAVSQLQKDVDELQEAVSDLKPKKQHNATGKAS